MHQQTIKNATREKLIEVRFKAHMQLVSEAEQADHAWRKSYLHT